MRYLGSAIVAAGFAAAAGCKDKEIGSEYEAANLEPAAISTDLELENNRRDLTGDLTSEGASKSWTLRVDAQQVDIYTPTGADLSVLDGLAGARVSLALDPITEERSLRVTDTAGALYYLVEPVEAGALTEEQFGLGLVAPANELGKLQQGAYEVTLLSAWLRTDTGDVELLPGEPQAVTIEGTSFRAVLLSAFTTELTRDDAVICTGADSRLSIELARLADGASADLTPLVRSEGSAPPVGSCDSAPELPE